MEDDEPHAVTRARLLNSLSLLKEIVLFLQTQGLYVDYLAWRRERRRERRVRSREEQFRRATRQGNSDVSTCEESSETSSES